MPLDAARTVAVNALVMGEIFYLFNSRYHLRFSTVAPRIVGQPPVLITIG
jgi:hypothetical protein